MKRILFITDFFRPEPGGLEGMFTGIARNWAQEGIEVLVTAGEKDYLSHQDERSLFDRSENYPIYRVSSNGRSSFFSRKSDLLTQLVRERIEVFRPEHIIFGQISPRNFQSLPVVRANQNPYSVFLNGSDFKNKLSLLNFRERRMVLGAHNVFMMSRHLARGARGFGIAEDRISVIPPGMEPRWEQPKRRSLPPALRERFKKRLLIMGVGPFIPRKGLDQAIEALRLLSDIHDKIHLVLVGSGPEYSYLEELIRIRGLGDVVTLTGFVQDELYAQLMKAADVFIHPGCEREDDMEVLSTTLMEAAWFGLPSVVGNIGGVDEIIRDRFSGLLVEPGDTNAFAEKIRELCSSNSLKTRLGKNAAEIARRDFDMNRTCAAIAKRL